MKKLNSIKIALPSFITLLFFTLIALSVSNNVNAANTKSVTFQWQANPADEYVVGYRLYYGSQSRYNDDGSLKENFSYTQFIDFMDQVRCSGSDYSYCEALSTQDLQCENLYTGTPLCTVNGLSGTLYFTMTAYTNTAESSFTSELLTPGQQQALGHILETLLLSD